MLFHDLCVTIVKEGGGEVESNKRLFGTMRTERTNVTKINNNRKWHKLSHTSRYEGMIKQFLSKYSCSVLKWYDMKTKTKRIDT